MRITRKAGGGLVALALGLALAAVPTPAHAAPIACNVPALQAAITAANVSGGTIDLAPNCVYSVTDAQAIGDNAMPVIVNDITINGSNSVIERAPAAATAFRIFEVDDPAGELTLNRVTIRNGLAPGSGGGVFVNTGRTLTLGPQTVVTDNEATGNGGGVYSNGTVLTQSATVSENNADVDGGGLFNDLDGTLTLRSTIVRDNGTVDDGGGVFNGGTATLFSTVVSDNVSIDQGGGFYNDEAATINSSRISGNEADNEGGGLFNSGTLNVNSSAVTANRVTVAAATSRGGGLFNETGTTTFTGSAIYQNSVAPPGEGGGIYESPGTTVNLVRSNVYSNTPDNCRPPGAVPGCTG